MGLHEIAAMVAAVLLGALILFQLALALGAPLGCMAWGGKHEGKLPGKLRLSSAAAVPILALAAWIVLSRADLVAPGADPFWVRAGTWAFAAYFVLNTLANLTSKSASERAVMTPITVVLVASFVVVALS